MTREKPRSRLAALEREAGKLQTECDRHYERLRDAFLKMDRARQSLARVNQKIDAALDADLNKKS